MRKYNRLKERYYETNFINDEDTHTEVELPKDFPSNVPIGAYRAFIDCVYFGDDTGWDLDVFWNTFEGEWGTVEDFTEHYYKDIDIWEDGDDEDSFENDSFYNCVDFEALGKYVKDILGDDVRRYSKTKELSNEEDEEKNYYIEWIADYIWFFTEYYRYSNEAFAKGYIMAKAERENISYRDAVYEIDEDETSILDWKKGKGIINSYYTYSNGFFFNA